MVGLLAACTWLTSVTSPAHAETLSGPARILDGDTVVINEVHIRLAGIDAPEKEQVCLDEKGEPWRCGIAARSALATLASGLPWQCQLQPGLDRYRRRLGTCTVGGANMNARMVESGYALG